MKKASWALVAVVVVLASTWLFLKNRPGFVVENNKSGMTMQQYLEKNGEFVSFGNSVRADVPFRYVFNYIIIIDRVAFQTEKYKSDHPEDGLLCVGKRFEETRCFIFTNRTPPQEIRELYRYIK